MEEWIKKSEVLELLGLPSDILFEYIHELKGVWVDEDWQNDKWIPCSERLPEHNEMSEYYDSVIVTLNNGRVAEGCYINEDEEWWVDAEDGEHYSINATGYVIAWQPLPEPYKEQIK